MRGPVVSEAAVMEEGEEAGVAWCRPKTLWEALARLEGAATGGGEAWAPVALCPGGVAWLAAQGDAPARVMDVWELDALRELHESEGALNLGGLTTTRALRTEPLVRAHAPALAMAGRWPGARSIPLRATLMGALLDGLPSAAVLPVLAAYDAEVALVSRAGLRSVGLAAFYGMDEAPSGDEAPFMALADELVLSVSVPKRPAGTFVAASRHAGLRIEGQPRLTVAVRAGLGEPGACWEAVRVCVGELGAPWVVFEATQRWAEAVTVGAERSASVAERLREAVRADLADCVPDAAPEVRAWQVRAVARGVARGLRGVRRRAWVAAREAEARGVW